MKSKNSLKTDYKFLISFIIAIKEEVSIACSQPKNKKISANLSMTK